MLDTSSVINDANLLEEQIQASVALSAPRLAGYEIIEMIGEGTYGTVWRARDTATSSIVAVKRFHRQPTDRSCEEVEHLAKLGAARGIVALWDVHLHEEPYCYVMEYIPGGTIAESLRKSSPRPFKEAWAEFRHLIEALCYVHKDGIVHGDIKPDNILIDSAGLPRLCDFGQARGGGTHGRALGTQFYMPPEQARMEGQPDPRWDVYAMGAILYELLTGKKPRFDDEIARSLSVPTSSSTEAKYRLENYARHLERQPLGDAHRKVPGVDASVAKLIEQCLTLDFDKRPADASAVLRLIDGCEHKRRSKPLIVFGNILPTIVFLLLGLATLLSGHLMLNSIRRAWTKNIQDSNLSIAQAISSSLRDALNVRMAIVQRAGRDPQLRSLIKARDQDGLAEVLARYYDNSQGQLYRWSIADSTGKQLANYGRMREQLPNELEECDVASDPKTIGSIFAWRGWFNGELDLDKEDKSSNSTGLAQFRKRVGQDAFVAQPYWREGQHGFVVLGISSTIAPTQEAPSEGVLLGLFPYNQLVGWVSQFEESEADELRIVVIVNEQQQIVYHPELVKHAKDLLAWSNLKEPNGSESTRRRPKPFMVQPNQADHLLKALENRNEDDEVGRVLGTYIDPLVPRVYLGSSQIMKLDNGQRFAVIVQQQDEAAMKPLQALQSLIYWLGWGLLGLGVVCLGSNAYAVYWFMKKEQDSASYAKSSS